MAKQRSGHTAIAKTFDRSAEIIYLMGNDFTIRYANPACSDWVGVELQNLIGAKCFFSSGQENEIDNKIAGLCPPPDLFENTQAWRNSNAEFAISVPSTDSPVQTGWRTAHAFRIANSDGTAPAILVIASSTELQSPPETNTSPKSNSLQLHQALAAIHHESNLSLHSESLVGASAFAHRLRRQSAIAAECNSDLLIIGPDGSGREHLARTIHSMRGKQAPGLLIPIHCPIADQDLLHSAIRETLSQRKRSQHANEMTPCPWLLLLDVDMLNEAAQAELLRFLQLPDFPLRVLSTAKIHLRKLAESNRFEPELAHHLSTMSIELIPLCKRVEDIPLLVQAMLETENLSREQQLSGFDVAAIKLLQEFAWPTNLNQLREVILSAISSASANQITPNELPKKFHDLIKAQRIGAPVETEIQLTDYLETIERELIARAFQQAKGNKSKAAKLLGVSRAKLLRRLQHFQPDDDRIESDVLEESAFEEID